MLLLLDIYVCIIQYLPLLSIAFVWRYVVCVCVFRSVPLPLECSRECWQLLLPWTAIYDSSQRDRDSRLGEDEKKIEYFDFIKLMTDALLHSFSSIESTENHLVASITYHSPLCRTLGVRLIVANWSLCQSDRICAYFDFVHKKWHIWNMVADLPVYSVANVSRVPHIIICFIRGRKYLFNEHWTSVKIAQTYHFVRVMYWCSAEREMQSRSSEGNKSIIISWVKKK